MVTCIPKLYNSSTTPLGSRLVTTLAVISDLFPVKDFGCCSICRLVRPLVYPCSSENRSETCFAQESLCLWSRILSL